LLAYLFYIFIVPIISIFIRTGPTENDTSTNLNPLQEKDRTKEGNDIFLEDNDDSNEVTSKKK
jgi:hypothetical protein